MPRRRFSAICGNPSPDGRVHHCAIVLAASDNIPVDVEESTVNLGRAAWLVTVAACLVAVLILILNGYYGYAGVTLAVAISAGINLL
jgi:hypothetical protein